MTELTGKETLDNIISTIDADLLLLDRQLTILWVNRKLKERPRFKGDGLVGNPCSQVYCNREKAPNDCPALVAFRTGQPVRQEHAIVHPDGSQRVLRLHLLPDQGRKR